VVRTHVGILGPSGTVPIPKKRPTAVRFRVETEIVLVSGALRAAPVVRKAGTGRV
jgi:hypothetical protein